ncbi:hypothetical protein [Streptomyces sp. STCH 565 A]|uniref:hypothetical protein n=1 Tax=Streptomyces sp. STCH 565 A TaxID=2950532 RepID=UPI002075AD0C|nr:hypothetical protein [Streptomyces sp. STCH 565 A]MCM8555370.1 hypothetical protein [Streptomyces sp. STCH 565 A]
MASKYPYVHTWDEDGIQRQAQIHQSPSGTEVIWDPRHPGDPEPWQDLSYDTVRHSEIDDERGPEDD